MSSALAPATSATGPAQRASRWRASAANPQPPYRNAMVVGVLLVLMASLFVAMFIQALGRPSARHVTVEMVGNAPERASFLAALEESASQGLDLVPVASLQQAEAAVEQQKAYAVLAFAPGAQVRLELSSAAGISVARVLTAAYPAAQAKAGVTVTVVDLHPLPSSDPSGLTIFYLVIGGTVLGMTGVFQLRGNAKPLPLRPWLVVNGVLAVVGSLALLTVVVVVLSVVRLPFLEAWGLLALFVAAASAFAATMTVLVGRWAMIPTWLVFVVFGNSSSGGAVSASLLPQPFELLSRVLPSGAAIESLRTAAYFPGAQHVEPVLVLTGWALACTLALVVSSRVRNTSPGL